LPRAPRLSGQSSAREGPDSPDRPARKLLVVLNRHASRAASVGAAIAYLAGRGLDLDIRQSADRNHLARLIREEGPAADAIVLAGGDGTVNGALEALIDAGRPVGILPCGTANDLALTLGIPAEPVAAAEILAGFHTRPIDVGRVNDVCFVNVASIGFSVEIARRQDEGLKKQWGVFSYLLTALGTLTDAQRFRAVITCDGLSREVEAYQLAVGNGVHYGGGLTIARDARIDDGLLDAYAIETGSSAEMVALAPLLKDGSLTLHEKVTTFRGRAIRVETGRPMDINTDGEVTATTPADFSVLPGALQVIVRPRRRGA